MNIEKIFDKSNWQKVKITYTSDFKIHESIPNKPGLYMIFSSASSSVLKGLEQPSVKGAYDIKKRIIDSEKIPKTFLINQTKDQLYCIYIGHQKNLRQRCQEHFKGSKGTACLSIFNHIPLREFEWEFHYFELSQLDAYDDSKLLRNILESQLRVKFGWPLLCAQ
jgi:hypothetical protein